jgi:hypothetical protein
MTVRRMIEACLAGFRDRFTMDELAEIDYRIHKAVAFALRREWRLDE